MSSESASSPIVGDQLGIFTSQKKTKKRNRKRPGLEEDNVKRQEFESESGFSENITQRVKQ
jgi:hypothetical protein